MYWHWMKQQSRQEILIYLAVWGLLFAAPMLSLYVRTVSDASVVFDWSEIFLVWRKLAVFLLLFLIHNFFLAPLLIHGHRRVTYFSIMAVILASFIVYQCSNKPDFREPKGHRPPPRMEMEDRHHPPSERHPSEHPSDRHLSEHPSERPPHGEFRHQTPPPFVGERDILSTVVLLLMFGANLGIKGYFRSRHDRKRLAELEHQNLEQQLEYLRYQINPHFFMNTLNNIHALVDIDPQKAQETIVELSKMMRFVLYEGDKKGVPLTREMEFIRTYVNLMQLRYTDKVRITLDLPTETPDHTLPPLILISFVENAFKHGVSYQQESFIEIKAAVENHHLLFTCRNSKVEKVHEERLRIGDDASGKKGGVGLANVRKRLNLLYDHDYSLRINDGADVYTVELNIPLS
jgi:hypothetical protein